MPKIEIPITPVFYPAYLSKKRYKRLQGGGGSGKSIAVAKIFLLRTLENENERRIVLRKVGRTVRLSVFATFQDLIKENGLSDYFHINKSEYSFYCANGSEIHCGGLDEPEKIKSIKDPVAVWMEEATEFKLDDFFQLDLRVRKPGALLEIFMSYNPVSKNNWVYQNFEASREYAEDEYFLKTTWRDNPYLPDSYIKTLEKLERVSHNHFLVYNLGEWGEITKGLIFPDYEIVDRMPGYDISRNGIQAQSYIYGIDFGFNDPMTVVRVLIRDPDVFVEELYYQSGKTIPDLLKELPKFGIDRKDILYFDSARPGDGQQIIRAGYRRAKPAQKGQGSIESGINKLKGYNIKVVSGSTNLIGELNKYRWDEDRDGNLIDGKPIDAFNHCFSGDTLISTERGLKRIDRITEGENVFTSMGLNKCLKIFHNGKKHIELMVIFTCSSVYYECITNNHKIWTSQYGWKEAQEIVGGDQLLCSGERNIPSIVGRVISLGAANSFTGLFGGAFMGKFLKAIISTTMMATQITTQSKTFRSFIKNCMADLRQKKGRKKIQNFIRNFKGSGLNMQKNGTPLKREGLGIENTQKDIGSAFSLKTCNVSRAGMNLSPKKTDRNFAPTNASLNTGEIRGLITSKETAITAERCSPSISIQRLETVQKVVRLPLGMQSVYDIMVESRHEYFANGVLVHNCIDAIRYAVYTHTYKPQTKAPIPGGGYALPRRFKR